MGADSPGDASDDLSQVGEAYDGLASAVPDLAQQRDALAPQDITDTLNCG